MSYRTASGPPRRRTDYGQQRREFLLFVEGKVTEVEYFTELARRFRERTRVIIDEYHGGPLQLVKAAADRLEAEQKLERKRRGKAPDEVWCVFDTDEHPNIPQALALAAAKGIHVACSNPCIELWFVLHYEDQNAYIHRHDIQKRSRDLLKCDKHLSEDAMSDLYDRIDAATARASALDTKHLGDGSPSGSNPSTRAAALVGAITAPPIR